MKTKLRIYLYHNNEWMHIGNDFYSPGSSWDGLSWVKRNWTTKARFWGGIIGIIDMSTEKEIWRSDPIEKGKSVQFTGCRYSGQDDDYHINVPGYGTFLTPSRFIHRKTDKARTGWVLWEYIQMELDAWARIRRSHQTEAAIRAEIESGNYRTLADTIVIDGRVFRYNPQSTDMYLGRWQEDVGGEWENAMANICPLLDALCRQPEKTHDEWGVISRQNREEASIAEEKLG